jgi:hypothetical protein
MLYQRVNNYYELKKTQEALAKPFNNFLDGNGSYVPPPFIYFPIF